MKKIFTLLIVGFLFGVFSHESYSQSKVWAGGRVQAEYVGTSNDCNQPTPYIFTLHFYRDFAGTAAGFADYEVITIQSQKLNQQFTDTLRVKSNAGVVSQYCLNGNPVATEGVEFSSPDPVLLDRTDDWRIIYA